MRALSPGTRLSVVLHLRHPDDSHIVPGSAEDFRRLSLPTSRRELKIERRQRFAAVEGLLSAFAAAHRLHLGRTQYGHRIAKLSGTVAQLEDAFGTRLRRFKGDERAYHARTGSLSLPAELVPWVCSVLGFDHRPHRLRAQSAAGTGAGLWPSEVGTLYGIGATPTADGVRVGIIAAGGGYRNDDLAKAAQESKRPLPQIVVSPANGNAFGQNPDADAELALDLQVLAGVAPGAKLIIYQAGHKIESLPETVRRAVMDDVNRPQVLSFSWGSAEDVWPRDIRDAVQAALADAVRLKIGVVVASGDYLATSGFLDGRAHVYYPASSPYVLSCGGTQATLTADRRAILDETVWNDSASGLGTGGGISRAFPVPAYQTGCAIPNSLEGQSGRGVPDVAAMAGADPGYRIVLGGDVLVKEGTSAAAPLWAALLALAINRRKEPIGLAMQALYANPSVLRNISSGDNMANGIGYRACAGWNACTGLGVPGGEAVLNALAAQT